MNTERRIQPLPVKGHLVNRGITIKELAETIGVSREHLVRVLNRREPLSRDIAVSISLALGLDVDETCLLLGPPKGWGAGTTAERDEPPTMSLLLPGADLAAVRRAVRDDAAALTAATIRLNEVAAGQAYGRPGADDEVLDAVEGALAAFWQYRWTWTGYEFLAPKGDRRFKVTYSPPSPGDARVALGLEDEAA